MKRKIIQIAAMPETGVTWGGLYALADDGTIWCLPSRPAEPEDDWCQVPLPPDMEPADDR